MRSVTERDDFDKIVEGLELNLEFVAEPFEEDEPAYDPSVTWSRDDDEPETEEEPFYRQVRATPLFPTRRGPLLAWIGLLGTPAALCMATLFGYFLPRAILAGAALIFVAAAIYLVLQLPEHGPSRPDWPDDGAVL